MRKICNYFLLFMVAIAFSSMAAELSEEEWSGESNFLLNDIPVIVKHSMSQMKEVLPFLEKQKISLKEAVFFFDFDETLAMTVGEYKGDQFLLLPSPDRKRTYGEVFRAAFENQEEDFDSFDFKRMKHANQRYGILDPDAGGVIRALKKEALFVGVCSGLSIEADYGRLRLLRDLGLEKNQYIHASDKTQAICNKLKTIVSLDPKAEISAVVLIENSKKHGIDPFIKDLPGLVTNLHFHPLTIFGIEFTKFTEMATQEAIEEELFRLKELIEKPTPEEEQAYWLRKLLEKTPKEKRKMLEKIKKMPSSAIRIWNEERKRTTP